MFGVPVVFSQGEVCCGASMYTQGHGEILRGQVPATSASGPGLPAGGATGSEDVGVCPRTPAPRAHCGDF